MFVVVVGSGHCGSRWVAETFTHPDQGVFFHHERKQKIFGGWFAPWQLEQKAGLGHERFRPYFKAIRRDLGDFRVVGDVRSWHAPSLPALHKVQPIDRVVTLVRHGILQVRSKAETRRMSGHIEEYTHYLYQRLKPNFEWGALDEFGKWCFEWYATAACVDWLQEALPDVPQEVWRLEDLTQEEAMLDLQFTSFGLERRNLKAHQQRVVNNHVKPLSSKEIWQSWSKRRRAVFRRICGEAMLRLGYR